MRIAARFFAGLLLIAAPQIFAKPIVEQKGRLTIDWSHLTIKFYGKATTPSSNDSEEATFSDAEKTAWKEGIQYAKESFREIHSETNQIPEDKKQEVLSAVGERAAKSSRSINTTYSASGDVRVDFESPLAAAVMDAAKTIEAASAPSAGEAKNSGVLLEIAGGIKPSAEYVIKDEDDKILYQAKDVLPSAYERNLMGRWYKNSVGGDSERAVGANPITVSGSADGQVIRVKRADWEKAMEGNQMLLQVAKIALVIQ